MWGRGILKRGLKCRLWEGIFIKKFEGGGAAHLSTPPPGAIAAPGPGEFLMNLVLNWWEYNWYNEAYSF